MGQPLVPATLVMSLPWPGEFMNYIDDVLFLYHRHLILNTLLYLALPSLLAI